MRVAIIGCGYVADYYARTLISHPELELVCVADRDPARAAVFAQHHGFRTASVSEVLDDNSIELVANLTSAASHYDVSRALLQAGKHVYSEKPLALDYAEARDLVELAAKRGLVLAGAPSNVLGESAQTAWKVLRAGAVGTPRLVYAELDDGPIHLMDYKLWRSKSGAPWPWRDEFATGCALEHAGYYLAWLAAFFGPATRVTTFASTVVPDKGGEADATAHAPDFSLACLEFPAGLVARLTCSIMAPRNHSLTIIGDEGVLEVEDCWDDGSPVFLTLRTSRFARWASHPVLSRLHRRRLPLVRSPNPLLQGAPGNRMDFSRGLAEVASSVREGRPCRLGADVTLHLAEITLAMRSPSLMGSPRTLQATFAPLRPMPWADP